MKVLAGNLPYAYRATDIDGMDPKWRKEFESEVADGNFLRGGTSLLLHGKGAEKAAMQWLACLLLAGYEAYRVTPLEIMRRMAGLPVAGDNEGRKEEFENAECIFIDDFFSSVVVSDEMSYLFIWFFTEAIKAGVTLVIATDDKEPELELYGPVVGDIIEETFEVVHGNAAQAKKSSNSAKASGKRKRSDGGPSSVVSDTDA